MRKIILLSLIISLIGIFCISALASNNSITWWYEDLEARYVKVLQGVLCQPFEEEYGIKVEVTPYPDLDRVLRVAILGGKGPDIVMTPGPSFAQEYAFSGKLEPLDGYVDQYGWKKMIIPFMYAMGEVDGTLYSIPKTYETMLLWYNTPLFDKYGWKPPKTIEEMETLAEKMMAKDIIPFASGNADWKPAVEWLFTVAANHIAGPEKVYQALKGEIPWTSPCFVESVNATKKWFQKKWLAGGKYFSMTGDDTYAMLTSGEAGMMIVGSWSFQYILGDYSVEQGGQECNWTPFPSAKGVDYPLYDIGIGTTLSINAESKNKDAVAKFFNFIISDPKRVASMNSLWPGEWNLPISALKSTDFPSTTDSKFVNYLSSASESLAIGNYGYTTWTFWPVKSDQWIINNIDKVWLDKMTTKDFLDNLQKIFVQELEDGKVPYLSER